MAHFYGLPAISCAPHTDSKSCDLQCGMEKMGAMLATIASAVELSINAGSLNKSSVSSYEQMLIDHELLRYAYRFLEGVSVNEDSLAFGDILDAGPGGNYLASDSTLRTLRSGENVFLEIFDRSGSQSAASSLIDRAHEKVEDILSRHQEDVSEETVEEIRRYVGTQTRA